MNRFALTLDTKNIESLDDVIDNLKIDYSTAQCKLLVYELDNLLNYSDYKVCRAFEPDKIIGQGAFGTIYMHDEKTIYKKSLTFNKLLDYMSMCDDTNEKLINLLIIILSIEKTTQAIKKITDYSPLAKHYNLPITCNLCICEDNQMALTSEGEKRPIPIYEYLLPFVEGIDFYKFLYRNKYTSDEMIGIIIQLLYITLFLNLNKIYHNDIHRKNILISPNTGIIELRGLQLNGTEISIDVKCNFLVVLIDFELAIETKNKIIPIDWIQSIKILYENEKVKNIIDTNEILSFINLNYKKIYDEPKEEGYRIYEINELNKLPILSFETERILLEICNKLKILALTLNDEENSLYKKKYLKYKLKYINAKKLL